ncbi:MAG: hypothetical protein ACI8WB_003417, partial [Phenylobacterium sp.]
MESNQIALFRVEEEQNGGSRAKYGQELIKNLSVTL